MGVEMILISVIIVAVTTCVLASSLNRESDWFYIDQINNLDIIILGFTKCYVTIFVPSLDAHSLDTPISTPHYLFGCRRNTPLQGEVST